MFDVFRFVIGDYGEKGYVDISLSEKNYIFTGSISLPDKRKQNVTISPENSKVLKEGINKLSLSTWQKEYHPEGFMVNDGFNWEINLKEKKDILTIQGDNAYPWCFYKLIDLLISVYPELEKYLKSYSKKVECYYA